MFFPQGAVAQVLDKNMFIQFSLASVIGGLNVEAFRKLTVQELLWGYADPLFDMARPILNLVKDIPDKLGLLVGVSIIITPSEYFAKQQVDIILGLKTLEHSRNFVDVSFSIQKAKLEYSRLSARVPLYFGVLHKFQTAGFLLPAFAVALFSIPLKALAIKVAFCLTKEQRGVFCYWSNTRAAHFKSSHRQKKASE